MSEGLFLTVDKLMMSSTIADQRVKEVLVEAPSIPYNSVITIILVPGYD
jgi:hypothetical protein